MLVKVIFREYGAAGLVNKFERMMEAGALVEVARDGYTITEIRWCKSYIADREVEVDV